MKTRIVIVAVFLAAAGGAVWWFLQPAPPPPDPVKIAAAPKPVEAPKPAPVVAPTKIAAPLAPPVAAPKPVASAPVATAQPAAATGTQAELNSAIDDISTMMQSGDMLGVMKKYMPPDQLAQIPPEQMAQMEQIMQQQAAVPQLQQMMQGMSQALGDLKNQTPEMNATGDKATYQLTMPAGALPPGVNLPPTQPVTFQKINGQWYIQNGPGGF